MTFPSTVSVAQNYDQVGSNWGTQTMPADIVAGNLFIAIVAIDGASETVTFGGSVTTWNKLADGAGHSDGSCTLAIAWAVAQGSDDLSLTNNSQGGSCVIYQLALAADPAIQPPELGVVNTGNSTLATVGANSPTGGAKDYKWLACCAHDRNRAFTSAPTNYGGTSSQAGNGNGGCGIAISQRETNTATEDPDQFTWATADGFVTDLIAVHPVLIDPPAAYMPVEQLTHRVRSI